jgi:polyphenol oxidase
MWMIEPSPLGRIAVPPYVPDGFAVFCTTRDFEGRIDPAIALRITSAIQERFGIAAALTTCHQVHGVDAKRATTEAAWRECDSCDALWSDQRGTALAIKIADCLPVTLIDPEQGAIANIHSGWRGAAQQIVATTLETITKETRFDAATSFAYLGPSIRECCFEVGEEVAERFDEQYVSRNHAKPHVDLPAFTREVLLARGFASDRISDSGLCTRCEGSIFHSYRQQGPGGGRNLTVAAW